jgi:tungstate transport system ATP-binding protein
VVEHGPVRSVLDDPQSPEARAYIAGEVPWASHAEVIGAAGRIP